MLPISLWTRFTWATVDWLTTPQLVVPPLLLLIALPWLFGSSRGRRWLSKPAAILLLVYIIAVSPPVTFLAVRGLVSFLPADSGATGDAIVVLERGVQFTNSRLELATQLWQAEHAPRIFVSGQGQTAAMLKLLQVKGIPSRTLSGSACARTTQEEATVITAILGPQGVERILLVTDPAHMLRSLLTFRSFGFTVIPQVSPIPPEVNSIRLSALAFREYLGLVSYALLGRFQPQPRDRLKSPPPPVLKELSARRCVIEIKPTPEEALSSLTPNP